MQLLLGLVLLMVSFMLSLFARDPQEVAQFKAFDKKVLMFVSMVLGIVISTIIFSKLPF